MLGITKTTSSEIAPLNIKVFKINPSGTLDELENEIVHFDENDRCTFTIGPKFSMFKDFSDEEVEKQYMENCIRSPRKPDDEITRDYMELKLLNKARKQYFKVSDEKYKIGEEFFDRYDIGRPDVLDYELTSEGVEFKSPLKIPKVESKCLDKSEKVTLKNLKCKKFVDDPKCKLLIVHGDYYGRYPDYPNLKYLIFGRTRGKFNEGGNILDLDKPSLEAVRLLDDVPKDFYNMKLEGLKYLQLSNIRITGEMIDFINSKNLHTLDLKSCHIGMTPAEFASSSKIYEKAKRMFSKHMMFEDFTAQIEKEFPILGKKIKVNNLKVTGESSDNILMELVDLENLKGISIYRLNEEYNYLPNVEYADVVSGKIRTEKLKHATGGVTIIQSAPIKYTESSKTTSTSELLYSEHIWENRDLNWNQFFGIKKGSITYNERFKLEMKGEIALHFKSHNLLVLIEKVVKAKSARF